MNLPKLLGGALFAGLAYLLHSQQAEVVSTSRIVVSSTADSVIPGTT